MSGIYLETHGCEGPQPSRSTAAIKVPPFQPSILPFHVQVAGSAQMLNRFSLRALAITDTELKAIAAPAIIGLSSKPVNG